MKQKKQGSLIIISGTTCAGKGTVVKELLKRNENLGLSISYTSRAMREGEKNGVEYFFVTQEEFEEKIKNGDFLEYANVQYGKYYGTPKKEVREMLELGKDVILEIDVKGAQQVKEMFPETILIFIMAPSMEEVKRRIKARGKENNEQIIKRFQVAYQEINEITKYNYVVVNDEVKNAVQKIEAILISEKCRVDRIEEIAVENQEEIIHEFLMDKDFDNSTLYDKLK
ncbi:MAG: guanylate kinase [Bacilli bacterium]|nr:guanylate kinase [Bacilli bacterium]